MAEIEKSSEAQVTAIQTQTNSRGNYIARLPKLTRQDLSGFQLILFLFDDEDQNYGFSFTPIGDATVKATQFNVKFTENSTRDVYQQNMVMKCCLCLATHKLVMILRFLHCPMNIGKSRRL